MSFFSRIGTSDITRLSRCTALVLGSACRGYWTCSGKGRCGSAGSNGSPLRQPNFIISKATRQDSWNCAGVSFRTSPSTVIPASSAIRPKCSRTMKCTTAASDFMSLLGLGSCSFSFSASLIRGPSALKSCACQFKQNLKSTWLTPCRLISASSAWWLICHLRPFGMLGWMSLASGGRLAPSTRPWRTVCGSQKALHKMRLLWKPWCKWRASSPRAVSR
mmetsp:Transcript_13473/g.40028  ORF Transcript_13473/g.40028 Transcript_13473/m.40028 type:complete len:219 (+) Transcript_13473:2-658(+)